MPKLRCANLKNDISITSIKACGLGGIDLTTQKMATSDIQFQKSIELNQEELLKDYFYQFLVVTTDVARTTDFLNNHFKNLKQKDFLFSIQYVGETIEKNTRYNS